jgi:hypothetical protein
VLVNGTSIEGIPRSAGAAHVVISDATVDTWYWDPNAKTIWVRVAPTTGPLTVDITRQAALRRQR